MWINVPNSLTIKKAKSFLNELGFAFLKYQKSGMKKNHEEKEPEGWLPIQSPEFENKLLL